MAQSRRCRLAWTRLGGRFFLAPAACQTNNLLERQPVPRLREMACGLIDVRHLSMGILDTQLRCNHCGARLRGDAIGECASCHSDLTQVGVWSELLEWGKNRRIGRTRYVWQRWVLGCGGLMALGLSLGFFLWGETSPSVYAWSLSFSLIGGYCVGRWHWRSAEREYDAAVQRRHSAQNATP
jgi:hypothetical protein